MNGLLSPEQYSTLSAICDTFVPSLEPSEGAGPEEAAFWRRKASDLGTPDEVVTALGMLPEDRRGKLVALLDALDRPVVAGVLTGKFARFADLAFEERQSILRKWSSSPVSALRQGYQAFKRLTHTLYYSLPNSDGENPNWHAISYPGPLEPPQKASRPIRPKIIDHPVNLTCDVVVIGSGAGGGVTAAELARAGHHVIVVEKGDYYTEAEYSTYEVDAYRKMYEQAGMLTTEDLGITVLAGSTLGGGTTINWAASFRTPAYVLEEWEREYGLSGITGQGFQDSLDAVSERLKVNTQTSLFNAQNEILAGGCERLGYHHGLISRNVTDCAGDECGWCCFGCISGAKQSVLKTYLQDAFELGADIIVRCKIEQVLIQNGRAAGVSGWVRSSDGIEHPVTIHASMVVLAAGAIHTPALLMRSGLRNPHIGRNLRLHPVSAARGEYDRVIEMWRGVILAAYSDEFANLDGKHYGVKLEVPPAHAGLWAHVVPWYSARYHKDLMLRSAKQAGIIVITRDMGSGRIVLDRRGRPRLHYRLHPADAAHLVEGLIGALKVHAAAGANEVGIAHNAIGDCPVDSAEDPRFLDYLGRVQRASRAPNRLSLFSAHQMGSCCMGGSRSVSALDPNGESWEVKNLFVTDASTFPTAVGTNPMLTVMAVAHHTAQYLKIRV